MNRSYFLYNLLLIHLCSLTPIFGQNIKAIVADKENHNVIPDVFVFIDNSSNGVITNNQGVFEIDMTDVSNTSLVFSHLNYELFSFSIDGKNRFPDTIFLTGRDVILDGAVVIEKSKPRLRNRWLKRFKNEFFGENYDGSLIKISNPEVLLFTEKKGKLLAESKEALVIENKLLGYRVQFFLESFESYKDGDLLYEGKVYFEEMKGKKKELAKFKRNRFKTYQQTSRSFFAGLVLQKLPIGQYEVGYSIFNRTGDFANYEPIAADSLMITEIRKGQYEISLNRILTVTCKHIKLPQTAQKSLGNSLEGSVGDFKQAINNLPRSFLWSKHGRIIVNKYGAILNVKEVEESGYWASLRIATLLPLDYKAKIKNKRLIKSSRS